ncbi:MAG: hypothetical protein ACOX64_13225 [Candidatus Merdivicinus sp.]
MEQAHEEAEKIFRTLLPQKGLTVREEQLSLCHAMLDALFRNQIALCDAGVGIGKTYAYLTACILWRKYSRSPKPVVISTSSVALQKAILGEYLPFLSQVFLENQLIQTPIQGIIRKGKERFVCDERLSQRLSVIRDKKKNPEQRKALDSLKYILDLDEVPELSGFDRRQVCVPQVCSKSCPRKACRYRQYLKKARSGEFAVQICNHNYLLADAIHRLRGLPPLLHDFEVLAVDEAHKLPEAARQMTGQSLSLEDAEEFCAALSAEGYPYTAMQLKESCGALWDTLPTPDEDAERTAFLLTPKRESALRKILSVFFIFRTGAPFPIFSVTGWKKQGSFSGPLPTRTGRKSCTLTMTKTKSPPSAPPAGKSRISWTGRCGSREHLSFSPPAPCWPEDGLTGRSRCWAFRKT